MKLIIGLGNPGDDYAKTRHNIGFMIVDNYAINNKLGDFKSKFNGQYVQFEKNGEKTILLKPQSYMNLSGGVIRKYMDYFKISLEDLFVISDDMDQEFLNYKLKYKGSCGGHNGLRDIESHINTDQYKRLKVGIGKSKKIDGKDYVTQDFSKAEMELIKNKLDDFDNIINDFIAIDFDRLMNKYN